MQIVTATTAWWRELPRIAKIAGYIGAISGAIVTTAAAWPVVEFIIPAHRGYVLEQRAPLLHRVIDIEMRSNSARRERLLDEFPKRELELHGEQAKQTPQYRDLIQQRLNKIKSELDAIDEQNKKLLREKAR